MKRLTALLLVCTLCFAGCGTEGQNSETIAETAVPMYQALPLPELYIEIPERFETTSSALYEEYYICEDASIIVTQDSANAPYSSVQDYAVTAVEEYQNVTSAFTVRQEETITIGSIAIHVLEFDYTIGDGDKSITKTSMVGYLTDTSSMYIITCKSDVDTYDSYREEFLAAIKSANFVK